MNKTEIEIPSGSPINAYKLDSQNYKLFHYLKTGATIHCKHPAKREMGIGYLNSRISNIVKAKIQVFKRSISVDNTTVTEYSFFEFQ